MQVDRVERPLGKGVTVRGWAARGQRQLPGHGGWPEWVGPRRHWRDWTGPRRQKPDGVHGVGRGACPAVGWLQTRFRWESLIILRASLREGSGYGFRSGSQWEFDDFR